MDQSAMVDSGVTKVTGVMKWFDVKNGFGFIVPNDGLPDVLLRRTCFVESRQSIPFDGATIECYVEQANGKRRATRICSITEPRRPVITEKPSVDAVPAKINWFNPIRGYGYVGLGDGMRDAFLHNEVVKSCSLRPHDLKENLPVFVTIEHRPKGPRVTKIWLAVERR